MITQKVILQNYPQRSEDLSRVSLKPIMVLLSISKTGTASCPVLNMRSSRYLSTSVVSNS